MSLRDRSYALAPLTVRVADVLREAAPEGLTLAEIASAIGTRWPRRHITALHRAGFVLGEQHERFFIAREPAFREPSAAGQPSGRPESPAPAPLAGGSLNADLQLALDLRAA